MMPARDDAGSAGLIGLRAAQGLTAGVLIPAGQTVLGQAVGPHRFGRVMASLGVVVTLAPALGPTFGGLVVHAGSWPWLFFGQPASGCGRVASRAALHPAGEPGGAARLDWLGLLLLSTGVPALAYGLTTWAEQRSAATPGVAVQSPGDRADHRQIGANAVGRPGRARPHASPGPAGGKVENQPRSRSECRTFLTAALGSAEEESGDPVRSLNLAFGALLVAATTAMSAGAPVAGAQTTLKSGSAGAPVTSESGADGDVVVNRDGSGSVVQISSESGRAFRFVPEDATPDRAALGYVARVAPAFGVAASDLTVSRVFPGPAGGSVVRLRQQVDGLPVLGGEMVMSLDTNGGLLSVEGNVATDQAVPTAGILSTHAVRVAVASVAKRHDRVASDLTAELDGDWLYDPAVVGVAGGLEPRRVWQVEVTDGATLGEMVLVDAESGGVLLHLEQVKALDRQVCDAQNQQKQVSECAYFPYPARSETGPVSAVADANNAFDLTGATARMYADVAGLDLTQLMGSGGGSYPKKLTSWVRYCATVSVDPTCPMPNAFWNGRSMFFGEGYAGADDVVAHEMTHGVIEKFSNLFYFHQSGAINESLADVMGEILDHRNPSVGDTADDWRLGEDIPGGAMRDLADPTLFGQPDRMTSPLYDADRAMADNGGVHTNSGVGNKTAYLISQGGTFNGVTVEGIDHGDPTLNKTATLYSEVIKRLTSGAGYADLARTLDQTCAELAATGTVGFTDADCSSVSAATRATELLQSPTVPGAAPPADVAAACPSGTVKVSLFANQGSMSGLTSTGTSLWATAPNASWGIPANARTGSTSLFGLDPDPGNYDDPYSSYVQMVAPVAIPVGQPTYLHFDHWRLFEWTDGASPMYNDGGQVSVFAAPDTTGPFVAQTTADDAWVNGPSEPLALADPSNPVMGFGGDSHGWTSSRLDLSSLAGQSVMVRWTVRGDSVGSYVGWFLDNPQVYTCHTPAAPGRVEQFGASPLSGPRLRLHWNAPTSQGDGLAGYVLTGPDGYRRELPVEHTTVTTGTLKPHTSYTFAVRAMGVEGLTGRVTSVKVMAPTISLAKPPSTVRKGTRVTFSGTVFAVGTRTPATGKFVTLQWRRPGTTTWHVAELSNGMTLASRIGSDGAFRIVATARTTLFYRVVFPSYGNWFPGTSTAVKVRVTS
jgi:bacillolysin